MRLINFLLKVKRYFLSFLGIAKNLTLIDVLQTFPVFAPHVSGSETLRIKQTILAINQVIPTLSSMAASQENGRRSRFKDCTVLNNIEFIREIEGEEDSSTLYRLFRKYGSDKGTHHNYYRLYEKLFSNPLEVHKVLEIGIGTQDTNLLSHMHSSYTIGSSLRAFRDFFPNSLVYGADIDSQILFEDDRIRTLEVDQNSIDSLTKLRDCIGDEFDLIIDDGMHAPNTNLNSFFVGMSMVRRGGFVIIEDIPQAAKPIWLLISHIINRNFASSIYQGSSALLFVAQRLK